MSSKQFDPTKRQSKDIIYRAIEGRPGYCTIWNWNKRKQKYVPRNEGDRFHAYKKVNGVQVGRNFPTLERAEEWRNSDSVTIERESEAKMLFKELKARFFEYKKKHHRRDDL